MYKLIIVSILIFFISCADKNQDSDTSKYKFEAISEINDKNLPEDRFFGRLRSMVTDSDENLYVIDMGLNHIKKFNKEGDFIGIISRGEGRGPGELLNPYLLTVDGNKRMYVYDRDMRKVIVLDSDNQFITEFLVENMPSHMIADSTGNLFLSNFDIPFPIKGGKIAKYIHNDNGEYELDNKFAFIANAIDNRTRGLSGNTDKMIFRAPNHIYFALWYPYEVRTYTTEGDSIGKISREVPFFKEPNFDSNGIVRATGAIDKILPLDDDLLAIRIRDISREDTTRYYFDFWKNNEFMGMYDESEIGIKSGARSMISNGNDIIYATYNEPETKIVKYRLQVKINQ